MSFLDVPRETEVPSAVLPGIATGAAAATSAMAVYQLIRLGFWVAAAVTTQPNAASAPVSLDRFVGLELLPSLLSLGPSAVVGALLGGLLGTLITVSWKRQGPIRAALTGALMVYVVALVINLTVLRHHRAVSLTYTHWKVLLGYPCAIFMLTFAAVGAWLYVSRIRLLDPRSSRA